MTEEEKVKLTETDQRSRSAIHQIDEIKKEVDEIRIENKTLYELTTSVKLIAQDMGSIKNDIVEVKNGQLKLSNKVCEIENKPYQVMADNVNKIKVSVITAICTFLVTGILGSIIFFATK